MTFLVDVRIKRTGHIVEIEGVGRSVNFDPKNYTRTLNALIDSYKQLQPDLADGLPNAKHTDSTDRDLQGL